MQYPTKEDERIALARAINKGLEENPDVFPDPPVTTEAGKAQIADYDEDRAKADESTAKAVIDVGKKDVTLGGVDSNNKAIIDWAERVTNGDDGKLKLIGWGGRADPKKLQQPSQPGLFELIKPLDGGGVFDWKIPKLGGKPASYVVRRSEDGIIFTDAKTVTKDEAKLENQPRGKKLWYHVIALNDAGESEPSNSVVMTF
jgi:hypothetical protein